MPPRSSRLLPSPAQTCTVLSSSGSPRPSCLVSVVDLVAMPRVELSQVTLSFGFLVWLVPSGDRRRQGHVYGVPDWGPQGASTRPEYALAKVSTALTARHLMVTRTSMSQSSRGSPTHMQYAGECSNPSSAVDSRLLHSQTSLQLPFHSRNKCESCQVDRQKVHLLDRSLGFLC